MRTKRIYLSPPDMGGKEILNIQQAFSDNWVAPIGPHVDLFERLISEYLNAGFCTAVSSGTAALHLALILSHVKEGDHVICPTFTFSATANPIIYQGAIPVFVDSENETWNMDPELLREAIVDCLNKNIIPKAMIIVHLYGMPAKMNEIMSIAKEFNISIIEDAAESLGSMYHNKHTGTLGRFGILSFNGNKIITTSGGGAIVSNEYEAIEKAKFLSTQARDKANHYQHSEIGYNYRLSNICAAIGCGQMEVLDQHIENRRKNFGFYQEQLSTHKGITFLNEPHNTFSNRWLTTMIIDDKVAGKTNYEVQNALESRNIESRLVWKPLHLQPIFRSYPAFLNGVSENIFKHGLCLPSGSALDMETLTEICACIRSTLKT